MWIAPRPHQLRHRSQPPAADSSPDTRRGFTIVELLIVIVVIGILAAITIVAYGGITKQAIDATLKSDLRSLAMAEDLWLVDNSGVSGTTDMAALAAVGFKTSPGNIVYVALNPNVGYCLVARNPGDSGGGSPNWIAYDSAVGGFLNGGKFVSTSGTMGFGAVACANVWLP